ncbi:MAG: HNH endonuclease [Deltaproteobacteria bacterium]|nr:HNH endonuclease [Deltaproteobacteria bacterium]
MPPKYVKSIRDEILYEYAKLISRSALNEINYRFVSDRFKALKSGDISMSGTIREWQKEQEFPKECVFCGAAADLETDHLIPRSRGGGDSPGNLVLSCRKCNSSRGDRGVFAWLGLKKKDAVHRLVAGKYLKELFDLHERQGTLDLAAHSISTLCPTCGNAPECGSWGTAGELTCLCLESGF